MENEKSGEKSNRKSKFEKMSLQQKDQIFMLKEVLKVQFTEKGTEHPVTLDNIQKLADLLFACYDYVEAQVYYKRCFEGRMRALGPGNILVYHSLARYAESVCALRRFDEAVLLFEEALIKFDAMLGTDALESLPTVEGLALSYYELKSYKKAEEYYQRTLEFRSNKFGKDDQVTLGVVNKLAVLYLDMKRLDLAETICESSLDFCLKSLGRDHPTTQSSVSILANVKYTQGKKVEAEKMYLIAYESQRSTLGDNDPITLGTGCR